MQRRDFLRLSSHGLPALAATGLWGGALARLFGAQPARGRPDWQRRLILVELSGGNDGLNTVAPHRDPLYRQLRPRLALAQDATLALDHRLGLHPALEPLMPLWQQGRLAVALGVGYDEPNRSHFRSIDIWESASDSDEFLSEGWLARVFAETGGPPPDFAADGIVIGQGGQGPFTGPALRSIALQDPARFLRQAQRVPDLPGADGPDALRHILSVEDDLRQAAHNIEQRMEAAPKLQGEFPRGRFGRDLQTAARILAAGVPVAALHVSQGGYDTHNNQEGTHRRLLGELAQGLAALATALQAARLWQDTLVMTYSEFGRRAAENGSQGTDHGTAAPHFLLGGRVRGGLYGQQPNLDKLDAGDLRHTTDFRRLYATAAQAWWGLTPGAVLGEATRPLDCLL